MNFLSMIFFFLSYSSKFDTEDSMIVFEKNYKEQPINDDLIDPEDLSTDPLYVKQEQKQQEVEDEEIDPYDETMFYNPDIVPLPDTLTYEFLTANITSFNSGIKNCFEEHYKRKPGNQVPLEEIVEDCVGPKGIFLIEYYNDIKLLLKSFLKQEMFKLFLEGTCDSVLQSCLYFLRQIFVFMETDLDIVKSINANQDIIIELIGLDSLQFYKAISLDIFDQYKSLKNLLKSNQDFLLNYVHLMRDQY